MAREDSITEELAGDNADLVRAACRALEAFKDGRVGDLQEILEQMANPKWLAAWHCRDQYNLEMGR